MTEAKGVNRETFEAKFGALALTSIPKMTGSKTTRAVASHNVQPETLIVLPTNNLTNTGVTNEAKIVEHDVSKTDKATSALAIRDTKFDAVPPD